MISLERLQRSVKWQVEMFNYVRDFRSEMRGSMLGARVRTTVVSGRYLGTLNFFRNMVLGNPTWDYRVIGAAEAAAIGDVKVGSIVNATDPNLRGFQTQGGKLILYHGWSDPGMSALATTQYYENVVGTLGKPETESFVRLYMAPGMQHCIGGPGPNSFGQIDLGSLSPTAQGFSPSIAPEANISSATPRRISVAPKCEGKGTVGVSF